MGSYTARSENDLDVDGITYLWCSNWKLAIAHVWFQIESGTVEVCYCSEYLWQWEVIPHYVNQTV